MTIDIRKNIEQGTAIIGTERTLSEIKQGNVSTVLVTSNCSEEIKEEIKKMQELSDFEIEELKETNEELGVLAKKPFKISVLSIKKEK